MIRYTNGVHCQISTEATAKIARGGDESQRIWLFPVWPKRTLMRP